MAISSGRDAAIVEARRAANKLGVPELRRHLLLCHDQDTADCATAIEMQQSWTFLKSRLKELGLAKHGGVFRTKTLCLDVCAGGPIVVVYPDGIWYGHCSPEVLERIIQEHLIEGRIVREHVIAWPKSLRHPAPDKPGEA